MRAILVPMGSAGDVHPFVGLGLALRDRGHEVVFLTIDHFVPLIRDHGFDFDVIGEPGRFEKAIRDPRLWHPTKSLGLVAESMLDSMVPVRDGIAARMVPGESVVAAGSLAIGARIARETMGVPLATVHLSPSILRSVHDTPILGKFAMPGWWPKPVKGGMYRLADAIVDKHLAGGVNAYRASFGLAPICRVMHGWWNSPDLVLAMFPDWYAAPQPDWPAQVVTTGFPLYDESDLRPLASEVAAFLEGGPPPILFAPGSAMTQGHRFFAESAEACRSLGARGLFVTKHTEQLPADLPEGVAHFPFIPYGQALPRCAAIVHHGGIGTAAQGLASGVPHLVRPLAHDQFDNARRLERLGVARSLPPDRYSASAAAASLKELTESLDVARRALAIALRMRAECPRERACEALERLASRHAS